MYIACMLIFQTQIQNILVTQVKPNSNDNFFEPDPSSILLHVLVNIYSHLPQESPSRMMRRITASRLFTSIWTFK